ncbi:MAG TPA: FAD-binding oxidoreductase [Solirubrobacteraceae bacterium]|nr:FAD-binding oxidoreductase [Solirubrobacteraceae bacterium]
MSEALTPQSPTQIAAALAGAAADGRPVRIVGGSTKLGWGRPVPADALRIQTSHLNRAIVNGTEGLTATVAGGTPLVRAQAIFARSGRMLAIDPQLGLGQRPAATIGGVLATDDSGPLAHRYGPPRAQVIGISMALSDGTVARVGPQAGEQAGPRDLLALAVGSFGTLGAIVSVEVRLHALPKRSATALGTSDDPRLLRDATLQLHRGTPGLEAFDVAWHEGRGGLLAQLTGEDAGERAAEVANQLAAAGLDNTAVRNDDAGLWARQRSGQRSADRAVVRVSARRSQLDQVLRLSDSVGAALVGRAALGRFHLTLNVNQVAALRAGLPPDATAVVLDLPVSARGAIEPWGVEGEPQVELMRRLKARFDPAGICNPGLFVGGI